MWRDLWGISFWVNSDTQKIANQGGNLTAEPWILTGLNKDEERKGLFSMIDDVQITNSHIMVVIVLSVLILGYMWIHSPM